MDKLKIVWICHLSNPQIRERIKYSKWSLSAIARRFLSKTSITDFAQWNTNAICEFEKFEDVELHVVAPFFNISGVQEYKINGIYYHFFHTEDDNIISKLYYKLSKRIKKSYPRNSKKIIDIIDKINPNIIHLIGAENPYYSESALYLNNKIPLIVSLQTLMCDPNFKDNYPISQEIYTYSSELEQRIIIRADYIGSKEEHFRAIIREKINPNAKFLDMTLAVGEEITISEVENREFEEETVKTYHKVVEMVELNEYEIQEMNKVRLLLKKLFEVFFKGSKGLVAYTIFLGFCIGLDVYTKDLLGLILNISLVFLWNSPIKFYKEIMRRSNRKIK